MPCIDVNFKVDMRVIEDRFPFSNVPMAKSKKRASHKAAATAAKQFNSQPTDDRESGGETKVYVSGSFTVWTSGKGLLINDP